MKATHQADSGKAAGHGLARWIAPLFERIFRPLLDERRGRRNRGLLGLAVVGRISPRAGVATALGLLVAGPAAVLVWAHTGNLLPWAVVQFGGMLAVLALACMPHRHGALVVQWGAVIAWYAVAKAFELADHAVFEATGQWVSGHTLKHLMAAGAALPVLFAMARLHHSRYLAAPMPRRAMQNGGHRGA